MTNKKKITQHDVNSGSKQRISVEGCKVVKESAAKEKGSRCTRSKGI